MLAIMIPFAPGGCDRSTPSADPAPPKSITLVISGDTDGWITPCGCTSNQSGGLLRRGTYLEVLRSQRPGAVLYADAGGAVRGSSDYDRLKFESILAGERLMGVAAHNIGRAEAALGPQALRAMIQAGAPIVSANVRDDAGQPVAEPVKIVSAAGKRLALVGVLSPRFASAGVRVDDPRKAVLSAAAGAKGQYDSLIVLAYLPQDELEQLAAAVPEADAVIGGPTGQPVAPRRVGPTLIASATSKGKFLAVLTRAADAAGQWDGTIVELDGSYADQPGQQENLRRYLSELAQRDFPPERTGLAPALPPGTPADYRIAGSGSCAGCHAAEFAAWQRMGHAHAWQTLAAKHFEVDPQCMQCHTTGYGLPGGFATRATTPDRVSVGCENCHGPSAAHVADPARRRTPFKAADQCTQCHDHENSPRFEFASYWARIQHGPATRPAAESEHARP